MEILAQSSTAFVLTHNFQGTHILGASRGRLSDSVASCLFKHHKFTIQVLEWTPQRHKAAEEEGYLEKISGERSVDSRIQVQLEQNTTVCYTKPVYVSKICKFVVRGQINNNEPLMSGSTFSVSEWLTAGMACLQTLCKHRQ